VVKGTDIVSWNLPFADPCLLSGYSGKVVALADGTMLKTVVVKSNCTAPPKPGWGTLGHESIHVFESKDGMRWRWKSLVCTGSSTGGEEGANVGSSEPADRMFFKRCTDACDDTYALGSPRSMYMVRHVLCP
jgi:hypothetical protein